MTPHTAVTTAGGFRPSDRPRHRDPRGCPGHRSPEIIPGLRQEVRYLGAILGDIIRDQEGEEVFSVVEETRRAAFAIRDGDGDPAALESLADRLHDLPAATALPVIRAFSHFSLLANLAEDLHEERLRDRRADDGVAPPADTLDSAWTALSDASVTSRQVAEVVAKAQVAPVLTAHPTETRRRTVFDVQWDITRLMRSRGRILNSGRTARSDERLASIDTDIRRRVSILWQTALIARCAPVSRTRSTWGCATYHQPAAGDSGDQPPGHRGTTRPLWTGRPGHADGASRQLDRRRPRRQPLRHRADRHLRHSAGRPDRLRLVPGPAREAGARAELVRPAHPRHRGSRGAGRPGQERRPLQGRRTLPPGRPRYPGTRRRHRGIPPE